MGSIKALSKPWLKANVALFKPSKQSFTSSAFDLLTNDKSSSIEIKILKKISQWPLVIEIASKKLEPHRIPNYLYELSSDFHSYWNMGKDNEDKRFINKDKKISNDKLVFLKSISNVVKSGMNIIGVDTPESM